MPLQNRVTPDAHIVAEAWRGDFMGNRGGRIHDPKTKTLLKRKWASKRWIICVTEFKSRQRTLMAQSYTELFFLDEVSALTAGHRPCYECRRGDAVKFATVWESVFGKEEGSMADQIDRVLHTQRIDKNVFLSAGNANKLADGAMVKCEGEIFARKDGNWLKWSGDGYNKTSMPTDEIEVLTPPAILTVLQNGYMPAWHKSAT